MTTTISIGGNQRLKAYNIPWGKLISFGKAEYLANIIEDRNILPTRKTKIDIKNLSGKQIISPINAGIIKTAALINDMTIFLCKNLYVLSENIQA